MTAVCGETRSVSARSVRGHTYRDAAVHTAELANSIVVRRGEGPPCRGDSIGATENAGFSAEVQRNRGLDFVTKQRKSLQKLEPAYSLA